MSLIAAAALVVLMPRQATSQPPGAVVQLAPFATGLAAPVDIASTAGDARLFVVEQVGRIKIVEPDGTVSGTFLDIADRVLFSGEQGLLGLAFAPDYASSGRFFVFYTSLNGNNQVSSFVRTSNTHADPASESPILTIQHPTFGNHNGGDLNFKSGLLHVSTGDGGGGNDPGNNAQNRDSLLGKILRLDVTRDDFPTDAARNYGIPPTNPFVGTAGADEIWVLGLRNPWRFSFDSATGDMYIGDVGQGAREEIDRQPAASAGGENYGWRCYEGTRATNISKCPKAPAFVSPVVEYDRANGRCAVTGGYVYRGARFPALQGRYFYMDFCSGELFHLQKQAKGTVAPAQVIGTFSGFNVSTFGTSSDGELYVGDLASNGIYRLESL